MLPSGIGLSSNIVVAVAAACALSACIFDWDAHDPRGGGPAGGEGGTAGAGGDGGTAGSGGDAGAPPGLWTVQPIEPLASEFDDDDPTMTSDLLELYFNSDRSGTYDIWLSTRTSVTEPWGDPMRVPELSSASQDTNCVVSPDGLSMWLSSRRDGQVATDVYVSTRADRSSSWNTPLAVDELNATDSEDYVDAVSEDTLTMVFHRNGDLYETTRPTTTDMWLPLTPIAELNTLVFEGEAWVSPDLTTIYFGSTPATNRDIFTASRSGPGSAWGSAAPELDFNTLADESDPWLSADLQYAVFSRGPAGGGARQLYEAFRTP